MPGSGDPYCSLVNVAAAADGVPLLLISQLALHARNILADARVSLLLDARGTGGSRRGDPSQGDPLEGVRVTLMGRAVRDDDAASRRRYLAQQPEAAMFADFPDFAFYRIEPASGHLVAGFGRIVDLAPGDLLTDLAGAEALLAAEADAVAHMNADHSEACRLYATRLLGAPDGAWGCVGCDPEGLDLQWGRRARRLTFPRRVTDPGALRAVLRELAERARAAR